MVSSVNCWRISTTDQCGLCVQVGSIRGHEPDTLFSTCSDIWLVLGWNPKESVFVCNFEMVVILNKVYLRLLTLKLLLIYNKCANKSHTDLQW